MGEADDVPPQSHREVSPTFEAEWGRAGPIADQAHQHAPVAEAFDEDAWFEQEAARLRQLNESKAQEIEILRLAALPAAVTSVQQLQQLQQLQHVSAVLHSKSSETRQLTIDPVDYFFCVPSAEDSGTWMTVG